MVRRGGRLNAAEFRDARLRLELTEEEVADDLGVTPDVVRAWAGGEAAIPRRYARQVRWFSALAARQAALRDSGLDECRWMNAHALTLLECTSPEALQRYQNESEAHAATCALCLARERYEAEHLGPAPLPPDTPGWLRAFGWIAEKPTWLVAPVSGALLLGTVVSFRVLTVLATDSTPPDLAEAGGVVLTAAGAGAAAGLTYSVVRPALRRRGAAGAYLTGIVCVSAIWARWRWSCPTPESSSHARAS